MWFAFSRAGLLIRARAEDGSGPDHTDVRVMPNGTGPVSVLERGATAAPTAERRVACRGMTLLPNLPQNTALLDVLREQGVPQEHGAYVYEGWELHTHPDLVERLEDLAPHWPVLATFGMPVLAGKGIAAVVASGMGTLLVRLPEAPSEPLEPAASCPPLTDPGQGWYSVCPWQSELPSAESKRLLSLLVRHALSYAASLSEDESIDWQGRPVQAPSALSGKAKGRRPTKEKGRRQGGRGRRR